MLKHEPHTLGGGTGTPCPLPGASSSRGPGCCRRLPSMTWGQTWTPNPRLAHGVDFIALLLWTFLALSDVLQFEHLLTPTFVPLGSGLLGLLGGLALHPCSGLEGHCPSDMAVLAAPWIWWWFRQVCCMSCFWRAGVFSQLFFGPLFLFFWFE